jgi:hypothetical protein
MSLGKLSPASADYFQVMQLTPERYQPVEECILRYSIPNDDCWVIMNWIVFRIFNLVKAIFGASEWQLARSCVSENMLEKLYAKGVLERGIPEDSKEKIVKMKVVALTERFAEDFLDFCLSAQNEASTTDDELRAAMEKIGTENKIKDIEEMLLKIRSKINSMANGTGN